MKLTNLKYENSEASIQGSYESTDTVNEPKESGGVTFRDLNLVTGINGSGKTRLINALSKLVNIISGSVSEKSTGTYKVEWQNIDNKYSYNLALGRKNSPSIEIVSEQLLKNGKNIIKRELESKSFSLGENPSKNKLNIIDNRQLFSGQYRDATKYAEMMAIYKWSKAVYDLRFSYISTKDIEQNGTSFHNLQDIEPITFQFNSLSNEDKTWIQERLKELDYTIEGLELKSYDGYEYLAFSPGEGHLGTPKWLHIKEMSQGLLRSFVTLTFLSYITKTQKPQLILIDNLCEGLDFYRARLLGKIVFEFCSRHKIQLIATSNDDYLINVVNLEDIIVLYNDDNTTRIKSRSYETDSKLYIKHKTRGLSNFDFLTTEAYLD